MNLKILNYSSVVVVSFFMLLTCCSNEVNSFNKPMESGQSASSVSSEKIVAGIKTFEGKGYSVDVPENWKMMEVGENQVLFTGPKVGHASVGFYISRLPKGDKNYLIAAQKSMERQSQNLHYNTLEEKDISQPGFEALMRRAQWFVEDINMELFVREIFTQSDQYVFILSGSIPNTPHLKELDSALVSIFSSFRFE